MCLLLCLIVYLSSYIYSNILLVLGLCVCVNVHVRRCVYLRACAYICMYARVYVNMFAYVFACVYDFWQTILRWIPELEILKTKIRLELKHVQQLKQSSFLCGFSFAFLYLCLFLLANKSGCILYVFVKFFIYVCIYFCLFVYLHMCLCISI